VPVDLGRLRIQMTSIERDLEPGDHIVAETLSEAGHVPWWERPATYARYPIAALGVLAAVALFIAGKHIQAGIVGACAAPSQLVSLAASRRKPTYIVVTTRRLYLIPLPTGRRDRARAITRTPLPSVRLGRERADRFRRVFRLEGPAFRPKGSQFLVTGKWRTDLDGVLAAIRTGDDSIDPAPVSVATQDSRS
jgi:hypothetical protein